MINTIGIIGGTGQMGRMFKERFENLGKRVLVSDEFTVGSEKSLVRQSDLIIISVPIALMAEVVERISPWLRENQLLSDFSSVKSEVIPSMIRTVADVVSCHPMFGGMSDMRKQNIIVLPVRPGTHLVGYRRLYEELGLNVVIMEDWKKHDESMSFIQGLMHFFHIVFTQTMRENEIDLPTIISICSPVYQANFAFACRILQRNPRLYTHILMDNPKNVGVLTKFIESARESLGMIEKKDHEMFMREFLENREFLGKYGKIFSDQSDFLIEKMKEYETESR